ncbi:hypothetical protein EP331_09455 [bacterium]|nr:MAG: hypothetical protein EP331_09455 [bacterium]
MGKTEHQIQLKGKIGPLIYYTVKGKQYVRTAPTRVKQPNTPEQLNERSKFAMASRLASSLYRAMNGWFLESKDESQRAYNQLVKRISETGVGKTEEEQIYTFETLVLTEGSLKPLGINQTEQALTWNLPAQIKPNTIVFIISIHKESLSVHIQSAPIESQTIPFHAEENVHSYLFYVQRINKKEKVSTSVRL